MLRNQNGSHVYFGTRFTNTNPPRKCPIKTPGRTTPSTSCRRPRTRTRLSSAPSTPEGNCPSPTRSLLRPDRPTGAESGLIMPHGRTKFNPDWLQSQDGNGDKFVDYFVPGEDQFHARCVICNKSVSVSTQGRGEENINFYLRL